MITKPKITDDMPRSVVYRLFKESVNRQWNELKEINEHCDVCNSLVCRSYKSVPFCKDHFAMLVDDIGQEETVDMSKVELSFNHSGKRERKREPDTQMTLE